MVTLEQLINQKIISSLNNQPEKIEEDYNSEEEDTTECRWKCIHHFNVQCSTNIIGLYGSEWRELKNKFWKTREKKYCMIFIQKKKKCLKLRHQINFNT